MNSIVLPIYNVEEYLEKCLNSLCQLPSDEYEIIAVNDGSTDDSAKILNRWIDRIPNLNIIHQQNSGLSAARNAGFLKVCGEFVAFIDSDDFIDSENLEKLFYYATINDADITVGDYWNYIGDDTHIETINASARLYNASDFFINYCIPLKSVVWRSIYKRSFLTNNHLNFHEGVCFEDVEFTPKAFAMAKKVFYSKIPFYYYRHRENSITTSKSTLKKVKDSILIWKELNKTASEIDNIQLSQIFNQLGFHGFLNQYSLLDEHLTKREIQLIPIIESRDLFSLKYKIANFLMKILPPQFFHILIKLIK